MFFLVIWTGLDDVEKKRLQQAYVIAVEQDSRDKIAKIAAHNNVPAVDLTTLTNNSDHHADLTNGPTQVELSATLNGHAEPELSASGEEPTLTATSADVPQDGFSSNRLSELFGEDMLTVEEPGGIDNPAFSLEFSSPVSSASENGSTTQEVAPPVQEPAVQPKLLTKEEAPPVDLTKLDATLNNLNSSVPSSTPPKNTMPEPSAAVRVEVQSHGPREVAVDCPPGFVAASGMKDPPIMSNNSTKIINGHTMTNGTDTYSSNSKQNNNTNFDSRNMKGSHKHSNVTKQQVKYLDRLWNNFQWKHYYLKHLSLSSLIDGYGKQVYHEHLKK